MDFERKLAAIGLSFLILYSNVVPAFPGTIAEGSGSRERTASVTFQYGELAESEGLRTFAKSMEESKDAPDALRESLSADLARMEALAAELARGKDVPSRKSELQAAAGAYRELAESTARRIGQALLDHPQLHRLAKDREFSDRLIAAARALGEGASTKLEQGERRSSATQALVAEPSPLALRRPSEISNGEMSRLMSGFVIAPEEPSLKAGDVAPSLAGLQYLSGEPIAKYEKDKTYIVDIGATWCGPCVGAIPHLNEIVKKYRGKVEVVGLFSSEQGSLSEQRRQVERFLAKNDPPVEYRVAFAESNDKYRRYQGNREWMAASKSRGIPTVFVIQEGRIIFMGNPRDLEGTEWSAKLHEPLEQIVSGRWQDSPDRLKHEKDRAARIRNDETISQLYGHLKAEEERSQWLRYYVVTELAKTLGVHMSEFSHFYLHGAQALMLHLGEPEMALKGLSDTAEDADVPSILHNILQLLIDDEFRAVRFDVELSAKVAEKLLRLMEPWGAQKFHFTRPVSHFYYLTGQFERAVELQKEMVAAVRGYKYEADYLPGFKKRLELYEAAFERRKLNDRERRQAAAVGAATIDIGSPAPKLSIENWLQGSAVDVFERGKVYLIEFFATWCGPCIAAMPHINEIARRFAGKLEVLGIAASEKAEKTPQERQTLVEDLIKKGDPPMHFMVGFDASGVTREQWLLAADVPGIPSSFVVDRDGTIAFIGLPQYLDDKQFGDPIQGIIAGTWQNSRSKERYERFRRKKDKVFKGLKKTMGEINAARAAHDWPSMERIAARAARMYRDYREYLMIFEAEAILHQSPRRGLSFLGKMKNRGASSYGLSAIVNLLSMDDIRPLLPAGDATVGRAAQRLLRMAAKDPKMESQLGAVARYYLANGRLEEAIQTQERVIAGVEKQDFQGKAEYIAMLRQELSAFQEALAARQRAVAQTTVSDVPDDWDCRDGVCTFVGEKKID